VEIVWEKGQVNIKQVVHVDANVELVKNQEKEVKDLGIEDEKVERVDARQDVTENK